MNRPAPRPPTVVLVHEAFTDASSWAGVITLLQAAGLTVLAPANPLRGLAQDAAYIRSVVRQIDAPVVLVGHGYGGAVITHAVGDCDQIVAMCYVAAFGLDAGESVLDILSRFAPAPVSDTTITAALPARFSDGPEDEDEMYLIEEHFGPTFAADLSPHLTDVLAVTQRPLARRALSGTSGPPGWACKPSWYAIAAADRMLAPTAQRFMAQRMAATEYSVAGSHGVVLSQPGAVAAMIREAAEQGTDRGDRQVFARD